MKPKEGLHSFYIADRIDAAHDIVKGFLKTNKNRFPNHSIGSPNYFSAIGTNKDLTEKLNENTHKREQVDQGGFEIHTKEGHIATVHIPGLGKPKIHVIKEHEGLGKAIAETFKKHAKFQMIPKVEKYDELPSIKKYYTTSLRKRLFKKIEEIKNRIK